MFSPSLAHFFSLTFVFFHLCVSPFDAFCSPAGERFSRCFLTLAELSEAKQLITAVISPCWDDWLSLQTHHLHTPPPPPLKKPCVRKDLLLTSFCTPVEFGPPHADPLSLTALRIAALRNHQEPFDSLPCSTDFLLLEFRWEPDREGDTQLLTVAVSSNETSDKPAGDLVFIPPAFIPQLHLEI